MYFLSNMQALIEKMSGIIWIFTNKVLILAITAQFFSMVTKGIIKSIKTKEISFKKMADYGGIPSSHTAFIVAALLGLGMELQKGFASPEFGILAVVAMIILVDAVKFRGNVDKINANLKETIVHSGLADKITQPKFIAHKVSEVVAGIVFAFYIP